MAKRLAGRCGYPADEPFRVTLHPERLEEPLHWRKPRMVFVCSMGDLFHEDVPDSYIDQVFAVMALCWQHTFKVLTKRPERMRQYITQDAIRQERRAAVYNEMRKLLPNRDIGGMLWPLQNVWVGVTAEDQQRADERILPLLQTPAAVKFVSCEPLLGPIDIGGWLKPGDGLDWVIVGGETGPGARPMNPRWVYDLRDQCVEEGVSFFFKSWGEWFPRDQWEHNPGLVLPDDDVAYHNSPDTHVFRDVSDLYPVHRVGKKAAGALLDGREWRQMPEVVHGSWGGFSKLPEAVRKAALAALGYREEA